VNDAAFMERALFWAERGRGRTSPNPMVGAVVVTSDGIVAGQGAHLLAGGPHAEVHALDAAGPRAAGATLYCTLEPCCHIGRTGPCVERVASAGVRRVVAAREDPNPRVAGKGFAYLRERGIQVEVGEGRVQATRQNEAFFCWIQRGRPFVIAKTAVSADGFVGRSDSRVKLTGPMADTWFHRQRAEIDALAVGSATVITDDPMLTPREVYRARPLIRVLFDWHLRIPLNARVFSTRSAGPVIMIAARELVDERADHIAALQSAGCEVEVFPTRDLGFVLARLAERGMLSLLVEGGPTLQMAFARAQLIDRVQRVATPRVLGRGVAPPALVDESIAASRVRHLGSDVLQEWDTPGV